MLRSLQQLGLALLVCALLAPSAHAFTWVSGAELDAYPGVGIADLNGLSVDGQTLSWNALTTTFEPRVSLRQSGLSFDAGWYAYWPGQPLVLFSDGGPELTLTFDSPVYAFGFEAEGDAYSSSIMDPNTGEFVPTNPNTITVTMYHYNTGTGLYEVLGGGSKSLPTYTYSFDPTEWGLPAGPGLFAAWSMESIDKVTITNTPYSAAVADGFAIGNLRFSQYATPEPATLLLLGSGFALAGLKRRRARK